MKKIYLSGVIASFLIGCTTTATNVQTDTAAAVTPNTAALIAKLDPTKAPALNFDLTKWKLNVPMEDTRPEYAGKVMEISPKDLSNQENPYSQPEWFYTNKETGAMVFVAPNKAMTTPNSHNARSELRAMLATSYADPKNNFVISAHPDAEKYGAIGGTMSATLAVDWVSTSGNDKKNGAFSTVIGQIHSSGNEPLKIVYRKLPNHEHGSLAWNYETNARGDNYDKREDIRHNVFGEYNLAKSSSDPIDGIKLGEVFSYKVHVEGNIMDLTFTKNIGEKNEVVKTFSIDLAKGHYKGHQYDEGYADEYMYFKAGNYNQCNVGSSQCTNKGLKAGDYAQVSFYQLDLDQ